MNTYSSLVVEYNKPTFVKVENFEYYRNIATSALRFRIDMDVELCTA